MILLASKFFFNGLYVSLYSLHEHELFTWDLSVLLKLMGVGTDGLSFVDDLLYPIDKIRNVLIAFSKSAHFDVGNEGFILFFKWICFPIVFMLTEF